MPAPSPTSSLEPAAIVFDCDGVLVDSDAQRRSRPGRRGPIARGLDPVAVVEVCHGQPARATVAAFVDPGDVEAALADIDRLELELAADVRALPGARELLARLPDGPVGRVHLRQPRARDRAGSPRSGIALPEPSSSPPTT